MNPANNINNWNFNQPTQQEQKITQQLQTESNRVLNQLLIDSMLDTCLESMNGTQRRFGPQVDPIIYNCFIKYMQGIASRPPSAE